MQYSFTLSSLAAALLLLTASVSFAADTKSATGAEAVNASKTTEKSAKTKDAKLTAKVKLVDINSAGKAELKTLPGIGDAEADKIIAGRPYLTKAHLVTHSIIPAGTYESIKGRIVAMQKPEEGAKPAKSK